MVPGTTTTIYFAYSAFPNIWNELGHPGPDTTYPYAYVEIIPALAYLGYVYIVNVPIGSAYKIVVIKP